MSEEEKNQYFQNIDPEELEMFSLPILLSKKISRGELRLQPKVIANNFYGTRNFLPLEFYKNVIPNLPEEYLERIIIKNFNEEN